MWREHTRSRWVGSRRMSLSEMWEVEGDLARRRGERDVWSVRLGGGLDLEGPASGSSMVIAAEWGRRGICYY